MPEKPLVCPSIRYGKEAAFLLSLLPLSDLGLHGVKQDYRITANKYESFYFKTFIPNIQSMNLYSSEEEWDNVFENKLFTADTQYLFTPPQTYIGSCLLAVFAVYAGCVCCVCWLCLLCTLAVFAVHAGCVCPVQTRLSCLLGWVDWPHCTVITTELKL